jgi:hypothetical protein
MKTNNLVMVSCNLINAKIVFDDFLDKNPKAKFCYRCWHDCSLVLVFDVSAS